MLTIKWVLRNQDNKDISSSDTKTKAVKDAEEYLKENKDDRVFLLLELVDEKNTRNS